MNLQHIEANKELAYDSNPRVLKGDDITESDRRMLMNSLFKIDDNVIYWYETIYQSKESIQVLYEKIKELTGDLDEFVYVIDLTRAKKPSAESRQEMKKMFAFENFKKSGHKQE